MSGDALPLAPLTDDCAKPLELPRAKLRPWLWANHGHPFGALYRDDGEMQCSACPPYARDYKRDPLDCLLRVYADTLRQRLAALDAEHGRLKAERGKTIQFVLDELEAINVAMRHGQEMAAGEKWAELRMAMQRYKSETETA